MKVLLILVDDVGALDLWADPRRRTPNLDRMAAEGRVYPIAWGAPLCSPYRAELLTGLESHRPGNLIGRNVTPQDSYSLSTSSGSLLPQLTDTWWTGKWHTSAHTNYTHPAAAGCETFRGSMANLSNYWSWERTVNGVPGQCLVYATSLVASDAIIGIAAERQLVVAAFQAPHQPTHNPPPTLTTFPPSFDATLQSLAMLEAADTCIGRLIYEANRHGYTCLFSSDNGSPLQADGKGTLYERGLRVPLLAWGAGVAQGTSGLGIQATDLRATILELLGASGGPLDGASFAADLQGGSQTGREFLHASSWPDLGQLPTLATWDRTVRDQNWHLLSLDGGATVELYDLLADPGELTNVAAQFPEQVTRLTPELPQL